MHKFGFIVHPLHLQDLARKFSFSSWIPDVILEKVLRYLPPINLSRLTGLRSQQGVEAEGYFVACTLTSKQILTLPQDKVLKQIVSAAKKAIDLGAEIIGLGAYTSIVGQAGVEVAKQLEVPVTTGNSYTVATALEAVKLAAQKLDLKLSESNLAIIGATGSIGKACSKLLASEVESLTLAARNEVKLKRLINYLTENIFSSTELGYSTDINSLLPQADIVITVSSSVDALVQAQYLKPGAIVCDIARPRDVAQQVSEVREDVLVIEGGLVAPPGPVKLNFDFGLPPGSVYACMAETMILALENKYENYTLGRDISLRKIQEIKRLGEKHGFSLAGLRNLKRPVKEEDFKQVKEAALLT
ncbi:shikimate dehydrogenase [Fuchsiella alkaliacetigena]|uniref:shikimate dehydrogenase n=1 Tax=Fuchsiella alkaliacetigena TaxID=957042 RepID=UPI00200A57C1|nr:shikimate dehydrogenase [Fuchsiella alkaliacetigena]MCK8824886.1 shikimate dehydrogenase [Fuchsiella alkaliacetigena]